MGNVSNCATCWVMGIDPKLRKIYDWSNNWGQFERCGQAFDGTKENLLCFSEFFAKTINWEELRKSYLKNKKKIDKMLGFDKEDGRTDTSETNV